MIIHVRSIYTRIHIIVRTYDMHKSMRNTFYLQQKNNICKAVFIVRIVAGDLRLDVMDEQTDTHTNQVYTVTSAVHVNRGLITKYYIWVWSRLEVSW